MSDKVVRVDCNVAFDENQEADIIKSIEELKSSHRLGKLMASIIRLAYDNPEILCNDGNGFQKGRVTTRMEEIGISFNRYAYLNQLKDEVNSIKTKVDTMYEMIMKTYTLALMGKHLGLEDKAHNELCAQFILEKQVKELQDLLGVSLISATFESNKVHKKEELAEDVLEYIINAYSGIVDEISNNLTNNIIIQPQALVNTAQAPAVNTNNTDTTSTGNTGTESTTVETTEAVEDNKDSGDQFIDFGDADMSALNNFFGNLEV